jgi:hypothetical protein
MRENHIHGSTDDSDTFDDTVKLITVITMLMLMILMRGMSG